MVPQFIEYTGRVQALSQYTPRSPCVCTAETLSCDVLRVMWIAIASSNGTAISRISIASFLCVKCSFLGVHMISCGDLDLSLSLCLCFVWFAWFLMCICVVYVNGNVY
jgi:hypothetical protein